MILIAPYLAAGICLGLLYFGGLWWNAQLLAKPGSLPLAIAVMAGRFAILGGALVFASLQGARPLLASAFGILVARWLVMRKLGGAT